ncbi:hypothetical protein [Limnohabitans sp. MMS-10A-192]|nr:hypothetical protein [Limnohabitans sp. MMS-10A-192]
MSNKLLTLYILTMLAGCGGGGGDGSTANTNTPAFSNTVPIANAGASIEVATNVITTLDGSKSLDSDNNSLNYKWTIKSKPEGSIISINKSTSAKANFTPDYEGIYIFSLIVNDGLLDSAESLVRVTATVSPTQFEGYLNGWSVSRLVSNIEQKASCYMSKTFGTSRDGIDGSFKIQAFTYGNNATPPQIGVSYCGVSCYDTYSNLSKLRVGGFLDRNFSNLNAATLAANYASISNGGPPILTTNGSPDHYEGLLDELITGSLLTVRAVPQNQFFSSVEGTISLSGFNQMLKVFNNCSANRP